MQFITITDFLLLPLYLFFLYLIIKIASRKYNGTPLRKYFITAFSLHMAGSFCYAMLIQFYYGYGDSFGFYMGSNFIRDFISNGGNPFGIFYISGEDVVKPNSIVSNMGLELPIGIGTNSNFTIMKISAILSYISVNSYLIISLFFGLFAFAGLWKLYYTLNEILDLKAEKLLAFTILYTPSICFWGSGLIKDTVCIGIVGFIIHLCYKLFIKKIIKIYDILFLIIFFYLLFIIKIYIASILVVSVALSFVILIFKKSKDHIIKLFTVSLIILISSVFLFINLSSSINSLIDESKSQIEVFKEVYANADKVDENSQAGFKTDDFELSLSTFIVRSPLAIFSTLFRPFLWETKKMIMLFSAIESFLMLLALLFVIYKCGIFRFVYTIFTEPYIFFAFIFTILLAAVVGFTTFNFGTLVRYRIPILPFYFFMLIATYTKNEKYRSIL